ncbi:glycoside hydrolase family 32 protein [Streptomyces sp. ISL-36]|uniref:glycoside hydrolase family 32 protein n=1 Tax=Streptomyces sp. ISL-36 TaxID=2819182 RepID=UPI001BEBF121|nr:glycoside hydrolase family 32 protein [Streptomyces sp. ISL-36]MBT2443265.1 glycoside hydrolase family 32 protein [Streptomyces sp. ISL-36]
MSLRLPSLSRRSLLLSSGLALASTALGAAAQAAPGARRRAAALPAAVGSPIPDPLALSGGWERTADGGRRAVAGADGPATAMAMSEHRVGARAGYSARIVADAATPGARGGLVFRAAADGSTGYAAYLQPDDRKVLLVELGSGDTLATAPAGTGDLLTVVLDGPAITVHIDDRQVLSAEDRRHDAGHVGLVAADGTVVFGPPQSWEVTTNLSGWTHTGGGSWTPSPVGLHAHAPDGTNIRAVAATEAYDTSLQADLLVHDPYAVAALLVRADAAGTRGYAVEADPHQGRLRLYRVDGNITLGTYATAFTPGTVHRLRIEAEGRRLRVFRQSEFIRPDGYAPVITAEDTTAAPHLSGRPGVLAYNGRVSYENITAADLDTTLQGWSTESGTWAPDLRGLRGDGGLRTAPFAADDLVLYADVQLAGAARAGLVLRGHEVLLDATTNTVTLLDRATRTTLATAPPPVRPLRTGTPYRVEVHVVRGEFEVYVDGVRALGATGRPTGASVGLLVAEGTAYFDHVRATDVRDHFTEPYRPALHYTQQTGLASDPNGLVHLDGEYHLFHQDEGRWAHAVSTDLLHWRALPIALPWNEYGHCWSGCAVVDTDDTTGLFGGGPGLLAYYTSYHPDKTGGNQCVRAAYSTDRGRSWQWYGDAPMIGNPGGPEGGWDFRDPKVTRDAAHDQWVMVVSGGDHIRFFTSRDLLHWTHTSSFGYGSWVTGGVWECPDLFQLTVDGDPTRTVRVLTLSTGVVRSTDGSTAQYVTGDWNGTSFTAHQAPGPLRRSDHGRDFYAAVTFDSLPDGRRVWLGWMTNWDYPFSAPTHPWKGQHSIPRELSLTAGPDGPVLSQRPIAELTALRTGTTRRDGLTVGPGSPDPLDGVTGTAYEIEAHLLLPAQGAATVCAFRVREKDGQHTLVGYDTVRERLFVDRSASGRTDFTRYFAGRTEAPLAAEPAPDGQRGVRLRILVDSSSVEVFGGNGSAVISSVVLPDPDADGLSFTAEGGTVHLARLSVHRLSSTCRLVDPAPAALTPPPTGEFRGDLGTLGVLPAGHWENTGAGRTGSFDRDSDAISARRFADLELTTLLRLGGPDGTRGAASLLWRASADGADGYCLNIDPDLRVIRLVVRRGGSFDDAAALARVPLLVRHGVSCPLRIVHQGTRIQVFLAGDRVIDHTDTAATYAQGHVGLNVFGGRAGFQDTYAKEL